MYIGLLRDILLDYMIIKESFFRLILAYTSCELVYLNSGDPCMKTLKNLFFVVIAVTATIAVAHRGEGTAINSDGVITVSGGVIKDIAPRDA